MTFDEPEWLRLGEALRRYDAAIGYSEPDPKRFFGESDGARSLHNAIRAEMGGWLTKAGASGKLRFKGASKAASGIVDIPTEYFRVGRTFTFENEILPYAAEQTIEDWADCRNFEDRHPTWTDAVAHRASFDNWLTTVRSAILQPASFDFSRLPKKKSLTLAETISFLAFGHALERGKISEWCDPSFLEREGLLQACLDEAQNNSELAHWPKTMPYDLERLLCETLFEEKTPKPWPPSATRLHELAIKQNLRNHNQNLRFAVAEALFHNGALEGTLQVTGIRRGESEYGVIDHRDFAHRFHLNWLADKIERGIFDGKDRDTWTEVFVERDSLAAVLDPHQATPEESAEFTAAFANQARWGLLPSLVWIATRDMALTAETAKPGETFHGADIGLSIRKSIRTHEGAPPDWPCTSLKGAWESELAVRMSEGRLVSFATRVSIHWDGGVTPNTPGVMFPPQDAPGAALDHFIDDGNNGPFLRPNGSQGARSWIEWHNPTFVREEVMALWSSGGPPCSTSRDLEDSPAPPTPTGAKEIAIGRAFDALWTNGTPPSGLSAKARNNEIRKWILANGLSAPQSDDALAKAVQRELKIRLGPR